MTSPTKTAAQHVAWVGETITKRYVFDAVEVSELAYRLGDSNPLHHDAEFAARSRFGGLIASAAHSQGVLVSVLAEHYTRHGQSLGLEFNYRLRKGIPVGAATTLRWTVTKLEPSHKLGGDIVALDGEIADDAGNVYISATARILVAPPQTVPAR